MSVPASRPPSGRRGRRPKPPGDASGAPADAKPLQPDYRVEALAKGLRVLSVFSERQPVWRITDIAAEVSLPLPTTYRIVMTLASEGYLEHLPPASTGPGCGCSPSARRPCAAWTW